MPDKKWLKRLALIAVLLLAAIGIFSQTKMRNNNQEENKEPTMDSMNSTQKDEIVLAGGCFWGMEELFRQEKGVLDTEVGYTGGENDHPTYENHPGHAEAIKVVFDPSQTDVSRLLDFFFRMHDPTTYHRQGNDIGSSYRSAIFYKDEEQKRLAEEMIARVDKSGAWKNPVVTSLEPLTTFWPAEDYHQDYLQKLPHGYTCHYVRPIDSFIEP